MGEHIWLKEAVQGFSRSGMWWVGNVSVRKGSPSSKGKMSALELQKVQSIKLTNALNMATAVGHCVTCRCLNGLTLPFVTWSDLCSDVMSHVWV